MNDNEFDDWVAGVPNFEICMPSPTIIFNVPQSDDFESIQWDMKSANIKEIVDIDVNHDLCTGQRDMKVKKVEGSSLINSAFDDRGKKSDVLLISRNLRINYNMDLLQLWF